MYNNIIHHFNSVCEIGPLSEVPYFLFPGIMVILIVFLCGIFPCRNHCSIITRNSEYLSSDQPSKSYSKLQVIYMYICIIIWTVNHGSGFEPGCAIAPIPHCNRNCPLKKRPRGQFVPFKI